MTGAVDYEKIRQFVLQVIREQERQEAPRNETAGEPAVPDGAEEREGDSFGFDEDALNGIMSSLEAFKRSGKGSLQDILHCSGSLFPSSSSVDMLKYSERIATS